MSVAPTNPYNQHITPPPPTVEEQVRGFLMEHQVKIGEFFAFTGFLLLVTGIIQASLGGGAHPSDPNLSHTAACVMERGIIFAVVGGVIAGLGIALRVIANKPEKREEENHLTALTYDQRQAAKRAQRAMIALQATAMIAFIGINMAIAGGELHDAASMNAGISFSVISGLASIASLYFHYKFKKEQEEAR